METIEQLNARFLAGENLNEQERQRLALYIQQNEQLKRSTELLTQENESLEKQIAKLDLILLKNQDLNTFKSSLNQLEQEGVKTSDLLNKLSESKIRLKQNEITQEEEKLKNLLNSVTATRDEIVAKQIAIQNLQDQLNVERELKKVREDMKGDASDLLALVGLGTAYKDTFVGKLLTLGDKEWEEGMNSFKEGLKEALAKPEELLKGNVGLKLTELLIMVTAQMASAFAELNKTGGSAVDNFVNLQAAMRAGGVGIENAQNAIAGLNKNFTMFSELSSGAQRQLAGTSAQLDKLGFAADSNTKLLSNLTTGFNMTAEQASDTVEGVVTLAGNLKMSVGELGTQFEQVSGKLSVYGAKGVTVFKELAATAKATGVEIGTLVSIAEKMDTFEGAAETAGKLNAVLGGGLLNASQLLNASESERIRLMAEAVQASGRSFDSLSKYEKMTIASAAGISDMAQANKIFGMSMGELDKFQAEAAKSEKSQVEMATALAKVSTAADSLKELLFGLVKGLAPLIVAFTLIVNLFLWVDTFLNGALMPTIGTFITLLIITSTWTRITAFYNTILAASKMAIGASALFARAGVGGLIAIFLALFAVYHMTGSPMLYVIGFTMAASLIALGLAAEISSKQLYALGAAMAGMALFAFAMFYGLAALADSLSKLNGPQLIAFSAALIVFVAALYLVLTATPAIPVLLAIGAALLMVGAAFLLFGGGIALVGVGVSMIFDSMSKAAQQGANLLLLGAALALVTYSLTGMIAVVSNPLGMLGIVMLVGALTTLSAIMNSMSSSMIVFVQFIEALSSIPEGLATRLEPLIDVISTMIEKINELDANAGNAFSSSLNSLSDLGEASIKLTPQNIVNVSNLVDQAERYRNVVNSTKAETNNLLNNLVNNVTNNAGGGKSSTPVNVSLELDKFKLGKVLFDIFEDKMGLNISRPS